MYPLVGSIQLKTGREISQESSSKSQQLSSPAHAAHTTALHKSEQQYRTSTSSPRTLAHVMCLVLLLVVQMPVMVQSRSILQHMQALEVAQETGELLAA